MIAVVFILAVLLLLAIGAIIANRNAYKCLYEAFDSENSAHRKTMDKLDAANAILARWEKWAADNVLVLMKDDDGSIWSKCSDGKYHCLLESKPGLTREQMEQKFGPIKEYKPGPDFDKCDDECDTCKPD